MATSGVTRYRFREAQNAFTGELHWGDYVFSWERTDYSIANNTSTISWTFEIEHYKLNQENITLDEKQPWVVTIDDKTYTDYADNVDLTEPDAVAPITVFIASGTATIQHNTDGTKAFTCTFGQTFHYDNGKPSKIGSGSYTLDAIPRPARIISGTDFTDEGNPTITYENISGGSVLNLQACISFDGTTDDISYRNIDPFKTTYTFELTEYERMVLWEKISQGPTATVRFYVKTSFGNGEESYSYVTNIVTFVNYKPTLSPTVEDINSTTLALTGNKDILVRYKSTASYNANAEGRKGAYITNCTVTNGQTYTGSSGVIYDVYSDTFYFDVTDSRGHTTSDSVVKTLVPYIPLTCNISVGIPTTSGTTTVTVSGNCFYGSFGKSSNTLTAKYRYRTDSIYSSWATATVTIKSDGTYTYTFNVSGLDYTKTYTFEAQAVDKLDTVTSMEVKVASASVFDWSKSDFNFNVPVNFSRGFTQPLSALKSLWNGQQQMKDANTSITLSETVSEQPNGIVLVFTPYNSSTGLADDSKLQSFFISKKVVQVMPSKMHTFFLMDGANFGTVGAKSLYISDTKVTGYANNSSSGTGTSTIKYDNTKFVLRWILGV